jgi:hypothetical protein
VEASGTSTGGFRFLGLPLLTGHALRDVRSILDAHYLHRDPALAESAIRKLELGYAIKTGTETSK